MMESVESQRLGQPASSAVVVAVQMMAPAAVVLVITEVAVAQTVKI